MAEDEDKRNDDEKSPDGENDKTGGQNANANSCKGNRRWNRHVHRCKRFSYYKRVVEVNRQSCDFCILDNLYDSFRFEIDNLWKRSTLLTAFLGLLFTGYAFTIYSMLNSDIGNEMWQVLNRLAIIESILGLVFSAIWTMMGKASKGWQEVYQKKIDDCEWFCCMPEPFKLSRNKKGKHFSDILLSTSAGRYSASRLNIVLGIVMLVVWAAVFLFHLAVMVSDCIYDLLQTELFGIVERTLCYLLIAFLAVAAVAGVSRSSSLGED